MVSDGYCLPETLFWGGTGRDQWQASLRAGPRTAKPINATHPCASTEDRLRVLEPLVRLHRNGDGDGSGLGLAICRRIAQVHDGELTL